MRKLLVLTGIILLTGCTQGEINIEDIDGITFEELSNYVEYDLTSLSSTETGQDDESKENDKNDESEETYIEDYEGILPQDDDAGKYVDVYNYLIENGAIKFT
ncbi:hypothetical protein RJG79_03615 [Mycoplasmatota bacterium WC44]